MLQKIDNPLEHCQLKLASSGANGEFSGYASVFNGVDYYRDTILPGAFKETLKEKRNPSMFVNHDSFEVPVGDWVKLKEDKIGLFVEGKIDLNHRNGPTVASALVRKAMDALSIGFRIPAGGAETDEDTFHRTIAKIDLKEISIVNFPADKAARISEAKAEIETITSLKDAELFLRDSEIFSKATATAFVSRLNELIRRDAGISFKAEITKLENELQGKNATGRLVDFINNIKI